MSYKNFMCALFGFVCMLVTPTFALAHTKWFAEGQIAPHATTEPTGLYLAIWALVVMVIVCTGVVLEKHNWFAFNFFKPRATHAFERAAATFSMLVGAFLIVAATHQYLFAPNLTDAAGIPSIFIILELCIGLAFLIGIYDRVAAVALILLWAATMFVTGYVPMLEAAWVPGSALFIMIMGNDYFRFIAKGSHGSFMRKYERYALPILRIGTGTTLFVLGFSEKILHPEFGINFLAQHHWNFMQILGFTFSDYLFTISAGSVESLFGLIFILGIVTRLNALVVAVVFTIPLFILGPIELSGHLPHFAAVVLLLLFGSGERFRLPLFHMRTT